MEIDIDFVSSQEIEYFLSEKEIKIICDKYDGYISTRHDIGFNLFKIFCKILIGKDSKDSLYELFSENNHSDIIKILLDPKENISHHEETKFLKLFLQFLRNNYQKEIDIEDYNNAILLREKARIDILIHDEKTKRSIIIENKIKGASDTNRQLPSYIEYLTNQFGEEKIDAIIYLTLDGKKTPNEDSWTSDDQSLMKRIREKKKLILLPAYNETRFDLYNGWILPCEKEAKEVLNFDAQFIFGQYGKFIKQISPIIMNHQIMENFLEIIRKNDETPFSIYSIMQKLPEYYLGRTLNELRNKFNTPELKSPFLNIDPSEDGSPSFLNWKPNDKYNFRITIYINESLLQKEFRFSFWDKNNEWEEGQGVIKKIYNEYFKENNKYEYTNNKVNGCSIIYKFSFPASIDQVCPVIKDFISTLKKLPQDFFEDK